MNSRTLTWIIAMTSLAALAMPLGLTAQSPSNKKFHHHYKLIDMGTSGGPESSINGFEYGGPLYNLNSAGTLAGRSFRPEASNL
jgi:hypothetical protein